MSLLEDAASLAVSAGFTDVDRAEVVFHVGVVRYSAVEHRRGDRPLRPGARARGGLEDPLSDRLRSDIFHWRARCHRRNRDWVAAEEDIERALELAEACADDRRRIADALFQASLVAQRQGRWVLARNVRRALATSSSTQLGDRRDGRPAAEQPRGLNHLLGDDDRAIALLEEAFEIFVELDLAGRRRLRLLVARRDPARSRRRSTPPRTQRAEGARPARRSRRPPAGDRDGAAHPRPCAARRRAALDEAERVDRRRGRDVPSRRAPMGHRSSAWIAQATSRALRGNDDVAAGLYRRAARALQESDVALDVATHGRSLPPRVAARDRPCVDFETRVV